MTDVEMSIVQDQTDPEAMQVWVDGLVGQEPTRFLLDTGAATCRVPDNVATRTLPVTGTNAGAGVSGRSLGEDEIVVPVMRLGNAVIREVAATRMDVGSTAPPLLGMSALGRHRCELRFGDRRLTLGAEPMPLDAQPLARGPRGHPMVPVVLDGRPVLACWDTGAGLTVVDRGFAECNPHLFEHLRATMATDSAEAQVPCELAQMAACEIAGVTMTASACAIMDLSPLNGRLAERVDVVIGLPVIVQADWTFDFPECRWSVRRAT